MIRTRYAPSPTGYMHIGNVRAALEEYLVAKSQGGTFVLRIEDTDQKREVPGAIDIIYETLRVLGIKHDEGPDVGGPYGPYIQSQRKNNYMEKALELIKRGKAYYCFCPKERLETLTVEGAGDAVKYDRHCLTLSEDEIQANLRDNVPFVVRQLIPQGKTTFHDELYGDITVDNSELDDQVLIKSDGFPTYNFANVIDDNAMKITHVVRGTEYLSSSPKYNLLYEALDFPIPKYIHVPTILAEDGKRYSKRNGAPSVLDMIKDGYLPEAILNFIALLGWSPADNREFFTLAELAEAFNVSGLSKSPSIVDMRKLQWMNGEYFKRMDRSRFYVLAEPYIDDVIGAMAFDKGRLAEMVQSRITFLRDIPGLIDFLPSLPDYDAVLYENAKQKSDRSTALPALELSLEALRNHPGDSWDNDALYGVLQSLAAANNMKNSQLLWPVRIALSGRAATPCGATELLELLGKETSLDRLQKGIVKLKNN